jgi:dihydroxyacetone kinase-like predicted kinase
VTVLAGDGAIGGVDDALRTWFARHRPHVTVDWHRGDQPLYPYLFGVE